MPDQHEVGEIELLHESVQVRGVGAPRVGVLLGPRAVAVAALIQRQDVVIVVEAGCDEVEPVRVRRPAVDAHHRPPSGCAVIQVVEVDAVCFDEMAGAGCCLQVGH